MTSNTLPSEGFPQSPHKASTLSPTASEFIPSPATICRIFFRTGTCNRGARCPFAHISVSEPQWNEVKTLDLLTFAGGGSSGEGAANLVAGSTREGQPRGRPSKSKKQKVTSPPNQETPEKFQETATIKKTSSSKPHRRKSQQSEATQKEVPKLAPPDVALPLKLDPAESKSLVRNMGGGTISVTFDSGLKITQITVLSSFSSTVVLKKLPTGITEQKVACLIQSHLLRNIPSHCIRIEDDSDSSTLRASVRFGSPAEAGEALTKLDNVIYEGNLLVCQLLDSAATSTDNVKLTCSWNRASCMAYVHFSTEEAANEAFKAAPNVRNINPRYRRLPSREYRGLMQYTVQLFGLAVETTEPDLQMAFPQGVRFHLKPPRYRTPHWEITAMIQSLFDKHAGVPVQFKVISEPEDPRQNALILVEDATSAERLFKEIKDLKLEFLGSDCLELRLSFSTNLRVESGVYQHIAGEIESLKKQNNLRWSIRQKEKRPVWITVSGANRTAVAKTKGSITALTRGFVVQDESSRALWDPILFSMDGRQDLIAAAKDAGLHLSVDHRNRTLTLHGSQEACIAAREPLMGVYQALLESKLRPFTIVLGNPDKSNQVTIDECINEILLRHNENRVTIVTEEDGTKITVRCNSGQLSTLQQIRQLYMHRCSKSLVAVHACAACLCGAEEPIMTTCGHQYCLSCFQAFIRSAVDTRKFPIRCFAVTDDPESSTCNVEFNLGILLRILTASELDSLLESALATHIQAHPNDFYYCPTADCTCIFNTAADDSPNNTRTCPQCFLTSCRSCRTPSHSGKTCEENRMSDDDKNLLWKKQMGTKDCPRCGTWSEKIDGCDHITCILCQAHWCWRCGQEHPANIIYNHIAGCFIQAIED